MTMLSIHVDDATAARLRAIAQEMDRSVEDLAGSAVSEAALGFFRGRNSDPGARPQLTPIQRDLARHALGFDGRHSQSWRNHFVTGEGSTDYPHWVAMVEAGWATRRKGSVLTGGDDLFRLTRAGADMVLNPGESLNTVEFTAVTS